MGLDAGVNRKKGGIRYVIVGSRSEVPIKRSIVDSNMAALSSKSREERSIDPVANTRHLRNKLAMTISTSKQDPDSVAIAPTPIHLAPPSRQRHQMSMCSFHRAAKTRQLDALSTRESARKLTSSAHTIGNLDSPRGQRASVGALEVESGSRVLGLELDGHDRSAGNKCLTSIVVIDVDGSARAPADEFPVLFRHFDWWSVSLDWWEKMGLGRRVCMCVKTEQVQCQGMCWFSGSRVLALLWPDPLSIEVI
jgi:hypothetical protein